MAARGSRSSSSSNKESEATEAKVDDYPERSYADVISDSHREYLKSIDVEVADAAAVSETVAE